MKFLTISTARLSVLLLIALISLERICLLDAPLKCLGSHVLFHSHSYRAYNALHVFWVFFAEVPYQGNQWFNNNYYHTYICSCTTVMCIWLLIRIKMIDDCFSAAIIPINVESINERKNLKEYTLYTIECFNGRMLE